MVGEKGEHFEEYYDAMVVIQYQVVVVGCNLTTHLQSVYLLYFLPIHPLYKMQ